ncbi:MAG: class I SAM-dependent methyltransferase [Lactobacillaceae bacterium]|jgi:predicted RNA methylase|nr:class I SAM-dependent methyltransferase [Lactobacillaceae bacterium]
MEYLAYTIYTITLILLIIFNVYIYYAIFSSKFGKYPPYVPTSVKRRKIVLAKISDCLKDSKKPLNVIDAGSGTGDMLIPLAKKFHSHKFIGIEWGYWVYLLSKLKSKNLNNIEFIHSDIFKQNFNNADIIYCYIVKAFEEPLSKKIIKEAKKSCLIITNGALFKNMELVEEIKVSDRWLSDSIYVHRIK